MQTLWQDFSVSYKFPVIFTRNAFAPGNHALAGIVADLGQVNLFTVVDEGVAATHPHLWEDIEAYAAVFSGRFNLIRPLCIVPGGEKCKEGRSEVEKLLGLFERHGLCRHSIVLAIGGGGVLDTVGHAAATAHRGIRLIRMPTTTLAQNDAGIGIKNGYNAFGRKNYIGTFAPPLAVLNDFEFLATLPPRHALAGVAEAVKVAVIKDREFFHFLCTERKSLAAFSRGAMERTIVRCADLHMKHVGGDDPFERGSGRPLDFGHWSAHALEELSGGGIIHGEAVAIGIALDSVYAAAAGILSEQAKNSIVSLLQDLGFSLSHPALAILDLKDSLDRFRQHLGGKLTITLPNGIGRAIDVHEMDAGLLSRSRETVLALYNPGR